MNLMYYGSSWNVSIVRIIETSQQFIKLIKTTFFNSSSCFYISIFFIWLICFKIVNVFFTITFLIRIKTTKIWLSLLGYLCWELSYMFTYAILYNLNHFTITTASSNIGIFDYETVRHCHSFQFCFDKYICSRPMETQWRHNENA